MIIPSSKNKSVLDDRCVVDREPQLMPGWPLLRKTVSANIETVKDNRARKMSVVQWVMNLPDRSLPAIQSPEDAEIVHNHSIDLKKELEIVLGMNPCSSCKWFTYDELRISTDYFSSGSLSQ